MPRSVSPYDTYYAFFAAPFKTSITQFNAIPFSFPDSLWQMAGITSVSVDFGDGAGYRTINKGSTVNIYYATEGLKQITLQLSTPSGTRTAKCRINYKRPADFVQPFATWNIEVDPVYTDDNSYLGQSRTQDLVYPCGGNILQQLLCLQKPNARMTVENGCDNIFDKPVIIVEGFDPDGSLTIENLMQRFDKNSFRSILRAYGYDLVYVDFTKNGDYIENNAKLLEAVINKVNLEKIGNNRSSIIGFSMGGLIVRWCLKDMEDRGIDHKVANFFSYDTPHQGANIPLGLQYLFREYLYDLPYLRWFNVGGFGDIADANESKAARQMLVTKDIYDNGVLTLSTLDALRAAFAQRLQNKGYPHQCINYGISFGRGNNTANTKNAGNGVQWNNFGPRDRILKADMIWFLVNFKSSAYAVPENNVNDYIAKYKFSGLAFRRIFGICCIPVSSLRIRNFKYTGQFPYDDAPGGYEITQSIFASSIYGWVNGAAPDATTDGHDGHNFISVASALDLQNQSYSSTNNWQSNTMFFNIDNFIQNPGTVAGNTLSNPALSPFSAVITSTSDAAGINNWHNSDITNANAQFILRKILNAIPSFNCQTQSFCNFNPSISGPDLICTTGQYQLNNLPNGVNILREAQNGYFRIDNGQGTNQISISKLNSGNETVKVTLTSSCGVQLIINKAIYLGGYSSSDYPISGPSSACKNQYVTFTTNSLAGATNYNWTWSTSNLNYSSGQGTPSLTLRTGTTVGTGTVTVRVANACDAGGSPTVKFIQINNCGFSFTASPNPSSGSMTISTESQTLTDASASPDRIYQIKVIDQSGKIKKQFNYSGGITTTTINLSSLVAGIYSLQAYNGSIWASQQIVKQ